MILITDECEAAGSRQSIQRDGLRAKFYSMAQIFHRSANTLARASILGVVLLLSAVGAAVLKLQRSPYVTAQHIAPEQLIVSSDCGFGRQGANREIAFYKASAIAQGCNIVRHELGLPTTYVPATDPQLQVDVVERMRQSKPS